MGRGVQGREGLRAAGGILLSFCMIVILLISSVEFVCYNFPGYFQREYIKHDVLKDLPGMEMQGEGGLLALTDHMMEYLRGNEQVSDLQFDVSVDGTSRPFFSERELKHMEDVRNLFIGGQRLRIAAVAIAALLLIFMRKFLFSTDRAFVRSLLESLLRGIKLFGALVVMLGLVCAVQFQTAFVAFHHLFFRNDLWLLDPAKDWLIRLLPQSFFFDTAAAILVTFVICLLLIAAFCRWQLREFKRNDKETQGDAA